MERYSGLPGSSPDWTELMDVCIVTLQFCVLSRLVPLDTVVWLFCFESFFETSSAPVLWYGTNSSLETHWIGEDCLCELGLFYSGRDFRPYHLLFKGSIVVFNVTSSEGKWWWWSSWRVKCVRMCLRVCVRVYVRVSERRKWSRGIVGLSCTEGESPLLRVSYSSLRTKEKVSWRGRYGLGLRNPSTPTLNTWISETLPGLTYKWFNWSSGLTWDSVLWDVEKG